MVICRKRRRTTKGEVRVRFKPPPHEAVISMQLLEEKETLVTYHMSSPEILFWLC